METYIVVLDSPYWVVDESLPLAKHRFKRLTGKYPSSKAKIYAFTGSYEDLQSIEISEDTGDIRYSKKLTKAVIQ